MENRPFQVPYIVHESAQARSERMIRRLVIALVLAFILIFASNALWLWAWMQYDYTGVETETVYTQDGQGINVIGDANHVAEQTDDNPPQDPDAEGRQIAGDAAQKVTP